ncbi:unnamed protein product [Pleuronectes platessa]|uniref:Uncharacterized protein n=1 Tax=Pleuronectes platessa TaxID=8262 RepID=A0A9N7ZG57_PLEPL|nr:unnamed protein product [Pleuronectes platessa]
MALDFTGTLPFTHAQRRSPQTETGSDIFTQKLQSVLQGKYRISAASRRPATCTGCETMAMEPWVMCDASSLQEEEEEEEVEEEVEAYEDEQPVDGYLYLFLLYNDLLLVKCSVGTSDIQKNQLVTMRS